MQASLFRLCSLGCRPGTRVVPSEFRHLHAHVLQCDTLMLCIDTQSPKIITAGKYAHATHLLTFAEALAFASMMMLACMHAFRKRTDMKNRGTSNAQAKRESGGIHKELLRTGGTQSYRTGDDQKKNSPATVTTSTRVWSSTALVLYVRIHKFVFPHMTFSLRAISNALCRTDQAKY
jgi:hypothetical protein